MLPGTFRRSQIPSGVLPDNSRTGSGATALSPWPGLQEKTDIWTYKMRRSVVKGKPQSGNQAIRLVMALTHLQESPDTSQGRAVPCCCCHLGAQVKA